jgi:hypothetical protein
MYNDITVKLIDKLEQIEIINIPLTNIVIQDYEYYKFGIKY